MEVEVAVLGSPSLIVLMVSVDVKQEDDEEFELSVANILPFEHRRHPHGVPVTAVFGVRRDVVN